MEILIIVLLLAAAAVLLWQKFLRPARPDAEGVMPPPQNQLSQELEQRMEEFMDNDQFTLAIQPVMDLQADSVCGGEVLSRLNHPERGLIFPDDFLCAMDHAGLYPRFDRYIFQKSCAWLSRSLAQGEQLESLSCNFSRKSLSEAGAAEELIRIADSYGLPHHKLLIEIMERDRETDARQFGDNLVRLKESGFRIILDDFGSGVTSVKDLMRYSLDIVKIDRSLLTAAETEQGRAVYRGLTAMAAQLGVDVICEGIETEEQLRFAQEAGCRYGQGFLFFRPMSPEQVFTAVENRRFGKVW